MGRLSPQAARELSNSRFLFLFRSSSICDSKRFLCSAAFRPQNCIAHNHEQTWPNTVSSVSSRRYPSGADRTVPQTPQPCCSSVVCSLIGFHLYYSGIPHFGLPTTWKCTPSGLSWEGLDKTIGCLHPPELQRSCKQEATMRNLRMAGAGHPPATDSADQEFPHFFLRMAP